MPPAAAVAADMAPNYSTVPLCPAQQKVVEEFNLMKKKWNVFNLTSDTYDGAYGVGRTLIVNTLQRQHGGVVVNTRSFMEKFAEKTAAGEMHSEWSSQALLSVLLTALDQHDIVFVDDYTVMEGEHHVSAYSGGAHAAVAQAVCRANEQGKKLVLVGDIEGEEAADRSYFINIKFGLADIDFFLKLFLGDTVEVSAEKVHRMGKHFAATRLRDLSVAYKHSDPAEFPRTEEGFLSFMHEKGFQSNVELSSVEDIRFSDLIGCESMIAELKRHVIYPFINTDVAMKIGMVPKKGIILSGRPGTGKTSLGRALAWELKGRFFLIDGTFIAGNCNFYAKVQQLMEAAKANAPSVVFIDDADVILKSGEADGLYHYLLSMLDGVENNQNADVAIIMTVMYPEHLPMALLRSGRFDLWLKTEMPTAAVRRALLEAQRPKLPAEIRDFDMDVLVAHSEGLIQADFGRLAREAASFYGLDVTRGKGGAIDTIPHMFECPHPSGGVPQRLVSTHNGEDPLDMDQDDAGNGFFTAHLKPGKYHYHFVCDGVGYPAGSVKDLVDELEKLKEKEEEGQKGKEEEKKGGEKEDKGDAKNPAKKNEPAVECINGLNRYVVEVAAHNPATCYMLRSVATVLTAIKKKQTTWQLQEAAVLEKLTGDGNGSDSE